MDVYDPAAALPDLLPSRPTRGDPAELLAAGASDPSDSTHSTDSTDSTGPNADNPWCPWTSEDDFWACAAALDADEEAALGLDLESHSIAAQEEPLDESGLSDETDPSDLSDATDPTVYDGHSDTTAQLTEADHAANSPPEPTPVQPHILVFVESGLPEAETLVQSLFGAGAGPGMLNATTYLAMLDSDSDGVAQITDLLGECADQSISAIDTVSHGSAALLGMGSVGLDRSNPDAYAGSFATWSCALTEDADILLYGCDIAAGDPGGQFCERLSDLTGADVAAATDITGSEERGGDWEIEFAYETVEAQPLQSLPDSIEYRELLENKSDKGTLTGTPDVDALTGEDNSNDTPIGLAGDDTLDLSALAGNPPAGAQAAAGGRGLLSAHPERQTMSLLHTSRKCVAFPRRPVTPPCGSALADSAACLYVQAAAGGDGTAGEARLARTASAPGVGPG